MKKTPEEVVLILDELSEDANQWLTESNDRRNSVGIANLLCERAPKTLPSDIEKNPNETIKVVSLRSGKTLADPVVKARFEMVNKKVETPAEKKGEEQKGQSSGVQKEIEQSRHMPALPFPQKMKWEKLDKCFGRFMEMLKQLYVNIPFTEILT
ncbi:uncharacterized protein [Nicotiana tomentosiformis]|uniref:uncharacterized protein n=1 Tax=Nicotiana tomentosiformis TaxID=4098 RepID=UPI00388CD4F2